MLNEPGRVVGWHVSCDMLNGIKGLAPTKWPFENSMLLTELDEFMYGERLGIIILPITHSLLPYHSYLSDSWQH